MAYGSKRRRAIGLCFTAATVGLVFVFPPAAVVTGIVSALYFVDRHINVAPEH